jgi:hypothetical protein
LAPPHFGENWTPPPKANKYKAEIANFFLIGSYWGEIELTFNGIYGKFT